MQGLMKSNQRQLVMTNKTQVLMRRHNIQVQFFVKFIVTDGFNVRGQVGVIDFQSTADGEFKWLMNYQDHGTKFLHLRLLPCKEATAFVTTETAAELSKIFLTQGAP